MKPITLVVESYNVAANKFVTSLSWENETGWLPMTKSLLIHFNENDCFNLVGIEEVTPDCQNCFYVMLLPLELSGFRSDIWSMLPKETIKKINDNNWNVMIFYPFESYSAQSGSEVVKHFNSYVREFLITFSTANLVHVSMNTYYQKERVDLSVFQTFNRIHFVPTVGFFSSDYYVVKSIVPFESNFYDQPRIPFPKTFLCLNNLSRSNRDILLQALYSHSLWDHGIISKNCSSETSRHQQWKTLLNVENGEHSDPYINALSRQFIELHDVQYSDHETSIQWEFLKKICIDVMLINNVCPDIQSLDSLISHAPTFNFKIESDWYLNSWCSIITETYWDSEFIRVAQPCLTEKTFKPLALMHPFVIFGAGHSHALLQKFGFKTFEQTWFGLPPDGAIGNITLFERLYHLVASLRRLTLLSQDELHAKRKQIEPDLEFNKNHLLTTNWAEVQCNLINEVLNNS